MEVQLRSVMQWKEKRTAVQKQAGLFSARGPLGDCRVGALQVSQAFPSNLLICK